MSSFIKKLLGADLKKGVLLRMTASVLGVALFIVSYYLSIRGYWRVPAYFTFGEFRIYSYSFAILGGIGLSAWLFSKQLRNFTDLKKLSVTSGLLWVLIPAIIGARLWHVATDWYLYEDNLNTIFMLRSGGLGIFGGIAGGALGAYIFSRLENFSLLRALDVLAVFLPLGQIVGRFGNFFNLELLGKVTNLPWGVYVGSKRQYFHPTFLYEQVGNLLVFGLIYLVYRRRRNYVGSGVFSSLYLLGYTGVRFMVDFFRQEPRVLLGLTVAQLTAIVLIAANLIFLVYWRQRFNKTHDDK